MGIVGGMIAAPISVAGGLLAAGIGSTAARVGVVITADTVGGAAAGAGTKMLVNGIEGRSFHEGLGESVLYGSLTGGISGSAGQNFG